MTDNHIKMAVAAREQIAGVLRDLSPELFQQHYKKLGEAIYNLDGLLGQAHFQGGAN